MELDEYKTIIRQQAVNKRIQPFVSESEIHVQKRSRSVINRIKRSLLLEMALAIPCVSLVLFITFKLQSIYIELYAYVVTALSICFTCYIFYLYRKIIHYQATIYSVKKTLELSISILEKFTRLYFLLTLVMVPLILIAGIALGYASIKKMGASAISPYSNQQLIVLAGICLAWYCIMYFFTKWYIRKLYGHHISELKEQLKELKSE